MTKIALNSALNTLGALALALAVPLAAMAQAPARYPVKPVVMVVPFAAGSATDLEARLYTPKLAEIFGQPFLIETKPGAGNRIATEYVMKAAPDGHVLMFTAATHAVIPLSFPDLPYDLYKVLAPVTMLTKRYGLMMVHPSVPATNMAEYVAYAKANPGKLNFVDAGSGGSQHLTALWLNAATGTQTVSVHYKAANAGILDLIAGRAQVHIGPRRSLMPFVSTGKARALAQASLVRHPDMPDLPTMSETIPGFEYPSWLGVLAPAATPLALRTRLSSELGRIVKMPDVVKALGDDVMPIGNSPQEFEKMYLAEHELWKKIVKQANVQFE